MASDIPAGWYPDIHGTVRWWDGQRWTEHVRETEAAPAALATDSGQDVRTPEQPSASEAHSAPDSEFAETSVTGASNGTAAPAATPVDDESGHEPGSGSGSGEESPVRNPLERYTAETAVFATQEPEPDTYAGATVVHRPTRTISYPKTVEEDIEEDEGGDRRVWLIATVVGLAAFFLGMGIGGRAQVDPPEASDPIPPAVNAEAGDIDQLRQQLEDRQAELDERQEVLDDREDELDRRASAPPTPSPSPSPTARPTETEIDGNGRVLVGTDVREGTYRTNGPTDQLYECEYTISEDEFGDDTISEDSTKTAAEVRLRDGDWFESDDCQDWDRE